MLPKVPEKTEMLRAGSCLCGGIRFTVKGEMRDVVACHCGQCRKQTGSYYMATNAPDEAIEVSDPDKLLRWYLSSDKAKRGFCSACGSALFWKHCDDDFTSILAGSIDGPTGMKVTKHIFTEDKGDFYEL